MKNAWLFGLGFVSLAVYGSTFSGTIEKIIDGDTVWVQEGRLRKKIRMMGIDAPETHLPTPQGVKGQQPWGGRAEVALKELAPVGSAVEVESFGEDKYGRTLGRLVIDGRDINREMVTQGHAIPYIICEGDKCSDSSWETSASELLEECKQARDSGVGIFDSSEPLKEMPFEFRQRHQKQKPSRYVGNFSTRTFVKPAQYKQVDLCERIFFDKASTAEEAGFSRAFLAVLGLF